MKSIRRERIAIIHAYGTPSVSEGGSPVTAFDFGRV